MTDQELEVLLKDVESDVVERKESLGGDARDTVRQAICAFANDLPDHRKPGVVLVGARDFSTRAAFGCEPVPAAASRLHKTSVF